ncbi:MAG TPA: hypothetical protein VIT44_06935 [Cyclobacteriaceae bacterium]
MKKQAKSALNISLLVLIATITSCKDENEKIATLRFETNNVTYSEDMSNVEIGLVLDRPLNVDFTLKAVLESCDIDSYLGGDFEFSQEIKIKASDTHPTLSLSIANDLQIDPDDHVSIKLIEPANQELVRLSGNPSEKTFSFTINNNDAVPQDKLQADLTWTRANPFDNINGVNFDLYLQSNVVWLPATGEVTDIGITVQASTQTRGFETVWLRATDPDQRYFIAIHFQQTYRGEKIPVSLKLNGLGFNNQSFQDTFDEDDLGGLFIGPFVKEGESIQPGGRSRNPEIKIFPIKRSLIEGRLPLYK